MHLKFHCCASLLGSSGFTVLATKYTNTFELAVDGENKLRTP